MLAESNICKSTVIVIENWFSVYYFHLKHIVELPFYEPGNVWSSKVFWLNHIDYVSLNSNPWDGNAPSLGNSWEPRKSKMAVVILVNYKMCSSLHYIMLGT